MRNLLWQSDAWKEYESLQEEKAALKKANKLLTARMRLSSKLLLGIAVPSNG